MWESEILNNLSFDIIIEDGLHEFDANLIFLENSLHKLTNDGVYICEDLKPNTIELFEKEIPLLEKKYPDCKFELKKLENSLNVYNDNNILVIKKF